MIDERHERLILVDETDRETGTAGKLEAHEKARLHRAFSVLLHDGRGNWLLQRRAPGKYHSGGLWTNTCCGHPRPGEPVTAAARRRLGEEMGIDCELRFLETNRYRVAFDNGLTENEIVHIHLGIYSGAVDADPAEAMDWEWVAGEAIPARVAATPERYSYWFRKYVEEVWDRLLAEVV